MVSLPVKLLAPLKCFPGLILQAEKHPWYPDDIDTNACLNFQISFDLYDSSSFGRFNSLNGFFRLNTAVIDALRLHSHSNSFLLQ